MDKSSTLTAMALLIATVASPMAAQIVRSVDGTLVFNTNTASNKLADEAMHGGSALSIGSVGHMHFSGQRATGSFLIATAADSNWVAGGGG